MTLDHDRDGRPDLIVANFGPSIYPAPNLLFKNVGGRFENVVDPVINTPRYSLCGGTGDIDGDGWVDVLICSKNRSTIGLCRRAARGS